MSLAGATLSFSQIHVTITTTYKSYGALSIQNESSSRINYSNVFRVHAWTIETGHNR